MKLLIAAAVAVLATPAFAQDQSAPAPAPATDQAAPMGGYQPASPPMSGTPAPGTTVRFQQAPSPSEAYPAPAAKDHYPPCRAGQHNGCTERENAAGEGIGGNHRGHHGKHWREHGKHWHHHHKGWHHRHHGPMKKTTTTTTTTTTAPASSQ
jgi:hypothetical protein